MTSFPLPVPFLVSTFRSRFPSSKDRFLPSNKEYWIEKGYNEEESIKKVKESQTTFSRDICIKKYGEEEGIKIWKDRQKKWQKSLFDGGNMKNGYSKISQELFDEIRDIYIQNNFRFSKKVNNNYTNKEIWKKDSIKKDIAELYGFDVLAIWDSDYKKDKIKILKKCLDFLKIK